MSATGKREFPRYTRFTPRTYHAPSAMTLTTVPTVSGACDYFHPPFVENVDCLVDSSSYVVGLRCVDRSGNLHPLAKKIMTALTGYRLYSRCSSSLNGLKDEKGLQEHSTSWSQTSSFGST